MPVALLARYALLLLSAGAPSLRLIGVWEGKEHAGGTNKPVAIVFLPRGPKAFTGHLYFNGDSSGAFSDSRIRGDSLAFREGSFRCQGRLLDNQRLSVRLEVRPGQVHTFLLHYTGPDTTHTPRAGGRSDVAPPNVARR